MVRLEYNLRQLYDYIPQGNTKRPFVLHFGPLYGRNSQRLDPSINNPLHMDLDAARFMEAGWKVVSKVEVRSRHGDRDCALQDKGGLLHIDKDSW
jgi:hypothetical protein